MVEAEVEEPGVAGVTAGSILFVQLILKGATSRFAPFFNSTRHGSRLISFNPIQASGFMRSRSLFAVDSGSMFKGELLPLLLPERTKRAQTKRIESPVPLL